MKSNQKQHHRIRRHKRVRSKITGTADRPRFSVFRSNRFMYAQLIDDAAGHTIVGVRGEATKAASRVVGKEMARRAVEKKITKAVFDRGGYRYHGRVRELAEGARAGGLII
jgi:large subunit ribosomal protein L18